MRKLLYIAALLTALTSCTKDEITYSSQRTVYDALAQWEADAMAHNVDLGDLNITIEFYPFEEEAHHISGRAIYGIPVIHINSNRWKGSDQNIATVYHEIGHVFGLGHGDHPIITALTNASSARDGMREKDSYFALIKNATHYERLTQ